jgi:soluble lytic murein transglycosylase
MRNICFIVLLIFASFSIALLPNESFSQNAAANVSTSWNVSTSDLDYLRKSLRDLDGKKWDSQNLAFFRGKDPVVNKIILWKKYVEGYPGTTFEEVIDFIRANPNWPQIERIKRTAEHVLSPTTPPDAIVSWFVKGQSGGHLRLEQPITPKGKLMLATALLIGKDKYKSDKETVVRLIKDAFSHKDLDSTNQNFIIKNYSEVLSRADYIARADMLVVYGRYTDARALYKYVPLDHQKLLEARISLAAKKSDAKKRLAELPKNLLTDEGLLFERVKNLDNAGKNADARRLARTAPKDKKYPYDWWRISRKYIRDFLIERKYQDAYAIAAYHGFKEDKDKIAEAEWYAGWIALRYLRQPDTAINHFMRVSKVAEGPITQSKAAYWLGRSYKAKKDGSSANNWFSKAAENPTVFHGQLAMHELGRTSFNPSNPPAPSQADIAAYRKNELAKATYILLKTEQHGFGKIFIRGAMKQAQSKGERVMVTRLAMDNKRFDYSLAAGRENLRHSDEIIMRALYPPLKAEDINRKRITAPPEELILSIIRQESAFDKNALSRAGAAGLMQLMPGTAKDVAKKLGLPYDQKRLMSDVRYNMTFGSYYLNKRMEQYDGNIVLATAAYNGGAGNVAKWIKQFGDPRTFRSVEQVVDWIELIPFPETSNYVMKILENLQMYRISLRKAEGNKVQLVNDLY